MRRTVVTSKALVAALVALVLAPMVVAPAPVAAAPSPPVVGGDPRVDPSGFRTTVFASGLDFPYGVQALPDGSLLVGTNRPPAGGGGYFSTSGELTRLADGDGDGVADTRTVVYAGLPGHVVALQVVGDLVFVTTDPSDLTSHVTVLRRGGSASGPYARVGSIRPPFRRAGTTSPTRWAPARAPDGPGPTTSSSTSVPSATTPTPPRRLRRSLWTG